MKNFFFVLVVVCFGAAVCAQDAEELRFAGNGIDMDAQGRVIPLSKERSEALGSMMESVLEPLPVSLDRRVARRTLSLKKLDAEVKRIVEQYAVLPDSIRYLGGLTSIDYILAVPEENDLLLVGPAEGWKTDTAGNVVGAHSGLPILALEDFLTALRTWNQPNVSRTVSAAFEPAAETQTRLVRVHRQFPSIQAANADAYAAALEEAYGDVPIIISGVSASSRFARILVAADFKMKRIAFGLEPPPARNISSYISLVPANRPGVSPQFWLTPEYAATTHDSRKLTWQLGETKVRATPRTTGGIDRAALTWCRNWEQNYDALAKAHPVFGELRNNMKLALAAALIHQENLLQRANCRLTILLDETNLKLLDHPVPKMVEYRSVQSRNGFLTIVACGGVEINPLGGLRNNVRLDNRMDTERARLLQTAGVNDGGSEWWSQ